MDIAVNQHSARSGTPFIIGVTGHRDLHPDDLVQLRGAVTQFVQLIKADFPDSELQFAIGMAEGADLLVAQTVLELGMRVNAILPMPLADYAADFDGENFATLQALLKHPGVECDELATVPAGAASRAAESRATMYVNLSETLTRRTTLLLALWDGRASPLPGGTADTILRYLGARTDRDGDGDSRLEFVDASIEGEASTSWAYWIPARRRDDQPDPEHTKPCFLSGFGDNVLQRHNAMPALLQHQLHELADYNREFTPHGERRGTGSAGFPAGRLAGRPAGRPAAARSGSTQQHRRRVRKSRRARRLLPAPLRPPFQVLQHRDLCHGGGLPELRTHRRDEPAAVFLPAGALFRRGSVSPVSRQALVFPTPHVPGDRRDHARQVLSAALGRRSPGQGSGRARAVRHRPLSWLRPHQLRAEERRATDATAAYFRAIRIRLRRADVDPEPGNAISRPRSPAWKGTAHASRG